MYAETDTFSGMRMFPTVYHREFSYVQEILTITLGFIYQLLYTNLFSQPNFGFITHTQTDTHHWRFHVHL